MKKIKTYITVIAIIMAISALFCVNAYASSARGTCGDNATYVLSNGNLTVSGTGAIKIYAFQNRSDIKTVTIDEGITALSVGAFSDCPNLTAVTFPTSLNEIDRYAFEYCEKLTMVTFLGDAPHIARSAFTSTYTTIGVQTNSTWTESDMAGDYGGHLEFLNVWHSCGDNAKYLIDENGCITISGTGAINDTAFDNNSFIKTLVIEDGITAIGKKAFTRCQNLAEVTVAGTVQSAKGAFSDCEKLVKATFREGITEISSSMFSLCYNLKEITIPESVEAIRLNAFQDVHEIENITLPEGLTIIEDGAFINCTKLRSVTIPSSVTKLGSNAFTRCYALKEVHFMGENPPAVSSNTFSNANISTISVPIQSRSEYAAILGNLSSKIVPALTTTSLPENGDGYIINHSGEFCYFIQSIAEGTTYSGKTVSLLTDVDMSGISYTSLLWPDTQHNNGFQGTFDGGNHIIKNLTIETSENRAGLFRTVRGGAKIRNLVFENVNVNGADNSIGCGALIGYCGGTITVENIQVLSGSIRGGSCAGGIIGENTGDGKALTIAGCVNNAAVEASNGSAGGIIGSISIGSVTNCKNSGSVTSKSEYAGGIVGSITSSSCICSGCENTGSVSGAKQSGEICGWEAEHTFGKFAVTTAPTCTEPGVETAVCANCGEATTRSVSATGHSFGEYAVTTEPTCTEDGIETATCTVCGLTDTRTTPPTGHSCEFTVTKAPTCVAVGEQNGICSVCGEAVTETIPVDPNAHSCSNYNRVNIPSTCTTPGEQAGTCELCGGEATRPIPVDPEAHKWRPAGSRALQCEYCKRLKATLLGSVFSGGSIWIIAAGVVVAAAAVVSAVVIAKKKKKQ